MLYLVANQHKPGRDNLTGRINGWKQILNTSPSTTATASTATTEMTTTTVYTENPSVPTPERSRPCRGREQQTTRHKAVAWFEGEHDGGRKATRCQVPKRGPNRVWLVAAVVLAGLGASGCGGGSGGSATTTEQSVSTASTVSATGEAASTEPATTAATESAMTLSGSLTAREAAASTACGSPDGGVAPVTGALESDWDLSVGGTTVGVLTWYAHSDADQAVSLSRYDLSVTMTYGNHNMNGLSGTVSQARKGHTVNLDVSFQDVDDTNFVVHAIGTVNC